MAICFNNFCPGSIIFMAVAAGLQGLEKTPFLGWFKEWFDLFARVSGLLPWRVGPFRRNHTMFRTPAIVATRRRRLRDRFLFLRAERRAVEAKTTGIEDIVFVELNRLLVEYVLWPKVTGAEECFLGDLPTAVVAFRLFLAPLNNAIAFGAGAFEFFGVG